MSVELLTDRERAVFEYISRNLRLRGFAPSVRDIQSEMKIKSTSTVQRTIESLEKKGYIHRDGGKSRTIRIESCINEKEHDFFVKVPMIKDISTVILGQTAGSYQKYIDFPLMGRVYGANALFAVTAKDDIMKNEGILKGDIMIINKSDRAFPGEIVMAVLDGKAVIKKIETGNNLDSGVSETYDTFNNAGSTEDNKDSEIQKASWNLEVSELEDGSIVLGRVISVMRFYRKI